MNLEQMEKRLKTAYWMRTVGYIAFFTMIGLCFFTAFALGITALFMP